MAQVAKLAVSWPANAAVPRLTSAIQPEVVKMESAGGTRRDCLGLPILIE